MSSASKAAFSFLPPSIYVASGSPAGFTALQPLIVFLIFCMFDVCIFCHLDFIFCCIFVFVLPVVVGVDLLLCNL